MGTALVLIGIVAFLVSARDHARYLHRLSHGIIEPVPKRSLGILVSVALAAIGAAMVAYLIVLAVTE
jgi:hypothetical protein